ncbi:MAG: hypothetical protein HY320_11265 [Armatimonadetes bacterium]|nr:hypothetical protein [Armatimonadota bacterium]
MSERSPEWGTNVRLALALIASALTYGGASIVAMKLAAAMDLLEFVAVPIRWLAEHRLITAITMAGFWLLAGILLATSRLGKATRHGRRVRFASLLWANIVAGLAVGLAEAGALSLLRLGRGIADPTPAEIVYFPQEILSGTVGWFLGSLPVLLPWCVLLGIVNAHLLDPMQSGWRLWRR